METCCQGTIMNHVFFFFFHLLFSVWLYSNARRLQLCECLSIGASWLSGHFMSQKRVRLGFLCPVEALTQVTTESSSHCHGSLLLHHRTAWFALFTRKTVLLDALVSVHIVLGGILKKQNKKARSTVATYRGRR